MPPKSKKSGRRSKRHHDETSDIEDEVGPLHPPRPFTELEGLPVSVDEPEYNLLNSALSLKDSAVLYSSLMKSRKAYTNGNIFELYWSKNKAKVENETSARDKMNKLCDCSLQVGPHTFDVRFFILKDEAIEKKREEDKNIKKEKRLANKKAREEKVKARELKLQNKATESGTIIPSTENKTVIEVKVEKTDANDDNESESDESDDENNGTPQTEEAKPEEQELIDEKPPHLQEQETPKKDGKKAKPPTPKKPLPPLQIQRSLSPSQSVDKSAAPPKPAIIPPKPRPQADPMQTPESQMMIANLNAIARVDPSLNALMKIVATGTAKPEQIKEFQGYIQRAKAMGPSPNFKQIIPMKNAITPGKVKKVKPPKEKQLTSFQELYVNGADLVFEFQENPNVRYKLPKDCIIEKTGETDILISLLIVHNQAEINKFRERKRARLEKQANKEKAKELITEPNEDISRRSTRSKNDEQETSTSKFPQKDELKEPIPYFTALSFKLTSLSERYDPIFLNSFNKYEEVKSKMEDILKIGVRVPKYYVWYSVDAYEDEALSENLRNELYLVENPPKGKYKKRGRPSADDKLQQAQALNKKIKV